VSKSDRDVMEILEAFDLTRCARSAAQLAGVDEKTVRYAEFGISHAWGIHLTDVRFAP
jgi:hypothetical protein